MPWSDGIGTPDPQSCRRHLTKAERQAHDDYEQRMAEELREIRALGPSAITQALRSAFPLAAGRTIRLRLPDPACWYWPAPETCTFKDEDTAEQFLLHWHYGMCAVCGGGGDLVCDHDHKTALVRGYLCRSCNGLEGHADGDGVFGKYRQRNPASILGIQVRYWSPWTGHAEPEPVLTVEEESAAQRRMRDAIERMIR